MGYRVRSRDVSEEVVRAWRGEEGYSPPCGKDKGPWGRPVAVGQTGAGAPHPPYREHGKVLQENDAPMPENDPCFELYKSSD